MTDRDPATDEPTPPSEQPSPGEQPGQWDPTWGPELVRRMEALWFPTTSLPADKVLASLENRVSRCAHGHHHD